MRTWLWRMSLIRVDKMRVYILSDRSVYLSGFLLYIKYEVIPRPLSTATVGFSADFAKIRCLQLQCNCWDKNAFHLSASRLQWRWVPSSSPYEKCESETETASAAGARVFHASNVIVVTPALNSRRSSSSCADAYFPLLCRNRAYIHVCRVLFIINEWTNEKKWPIWN